MYAGDCRAVSWSSRVKADHDDHQRQVPVLVWDCLFQLVVVMLRVLKIHKIDSQSYLFHSIGSLLRTWTKITEPQNF